MTRGRDLLRALCRFCRSRWRRRSSLGKQVSSHARTEAAIADQTASQETFLERDRCTPAQAYGVSVKLIVSVAPASLPCFGVAAKR